MSVLCSTEQTKYNEALVSSPFHHHVAKSIPLLLGCYTTMKRRDASAQILGLESQNLKISYLNNLSVAVVCLCLPGISDAKPAFLLKISTAKPAMALHREMFTF